MERVIRFRLTEQEIRRLIPYTQLAECGTMLRTGRAKRLMRDLGLSSETLERYFLLAQKWHLVTGIPADITFSEEELQEWELIGQLVYEL